MYKYSCRKCPIRNRCIDESGNSDSIRLMIRHAFEARTDTLATWGRLQTNCLLIKAEEEQKKGTNPLTTRLQQIKQAKTGPLQPLDQESEPKKSVIRRLKPLDNSPSPQRTEDKQRPRVPGYLQPVSSQKQTETNESTLKRLNKDRVISGPEVYWLTLENTQRHITLPTQGGIVLGRFDPNVGIPPDIDLSYDDRETHLISRRHATIFAQNGKHTIEDLGSNSGVILNNERIGYGPSRPLETGDTLRLGNIKFIYARISEEVFKQAKTKEIHHILRVTANGRKIIITPPKSMMIGRTDSKINFVPDIDLSRDGEVSRLVSRRHALIQWRYGQPYLEDLGSGFGTRLRGDLLPLGQAMPLVPGDHIWLAGCVLAYDIEL